MSIQSHLAVSAPPKVAAPKKFSVVVGLDFTDADGPAFDQAMALAIRVPGSELHLLHVFGAEPDSDRSRQLVEHLRLYVNEKAAMRTGLSSVGVGIHLRGGKAVRELIQLATDLHADLIVIGSHKGPHITDWVVGSTVEKLVGASPFPVLVASWRPKVTAPQEPVIEPPCPVCVQTRTASGGNPWWCERHSHAAHLAHTFSYQRELPMASHGSEFIPTGVGF
jgi:nucleotide-binding universal stress UspA family protein